jgi:crossover junction endodeoxyribonuclease RuvC
LNIIGIDPGSHRVGYSILSKQNQNKLSLLEYGVIHVPKDRVVPYNLLYIKSELIHILDRFDPKIACIEKLFFNTNQKTAILVSESRGSILLTLLERDIQIIELTVTQIKKGITGSGTSTKLSIKKSLEVLFGNQLQNIDDSWDAIAAAFVGNSMIR